MRCELLELEGSFNARDVGGYPAGGGKTIKYRRFIRTGSLFRLTEQGKSVLLDMGIRCVVDLRSNFEVNEKPDAVMNDPRFTWRHLPMLDYIYAGIADEQYVPFPPSLEEMYINLLNEDRNSFRSLFQLFASPEHESYLFHCTMGKDRTGVAAALLLSLAGVDDETIVEDYSHSAKLTKHIIEGLSGNIPAYLFASPAETMQTVLSHLKNKYGGGQGYLAYIGITSEQRRAILTKLLD